MARQALEHLSVGRTHAHRVLPRCRLLLHVVGDVSDQRHSGRWLDTSRGRQHHGFRGAQRHKLYAEGDRFKSLGGQFFHDPDVFKLRQFQC